MAHHALSPETGERPASDQETERPKPTTLTTGPRDVVAEHSSTPLKVTSADWRPIPRWPSYEVSWDGRVRSVDRTVEYRNGHRRRFRGVELAVVSGGVTLSAGVGHRRSYSVGRLVRETWGGAS